MDDDASTLQSDTVTMASASEMGKGKELMALKTPESQSPLPIPEQRLLPSAPRFADNQHSRNLSSQFETAMSLSEEPEAQVGFSNAYISEGNPSAERGEKQGKGLYGLMRRASYSIKSIRHRRQSASQGEMNHERLTTPASPWNKLRQAATFRQSRLPSFDIDDEGVSTSSRSPPAPVPGNGNEPPIIPRGSGGAAARATAAAQNEFYGRNRHLCGTWDIQTDRESGVEIAVTMQSHDTLANGMVSWGDFVQELPGELTQQIMGYLDLASLVQAQSVSKSWRQASGDNHVWRQVFCRERGGAYAMDKVVRPGMGYGLPSVAPEVNWRQVFKASIELSHRWRAGNAKPVYLNGHTDSIYCVQFDE